jgi:hypothetical protein
LFDSYFVDSCGDYKRICFTFYVKKLCYIDCCSFLPFQPAVFLC